MNGYKTYFVMGLALLYGITGFFTGNLDANTAVQVILAALGLGAVRHAIANQ